MNQKHVIVAGNIGVGKTSLVSLLSAKMDWEPYFEPEAANPYLTDFYKDMSGWAFHSQVFFLSRRLKSHHEISKFSRPVLQDRSVYEDAEIFAKNLHLQGYISPRILIPIVTYIKPCWNFFLPRILCSICVLPFLF